MTEKTHQDSVMPLSELCLVIDEYLMNEMKADPLRIMLDIFDYFNSPKKPLSPREFFQFWASLTDEDKTYYIISTTEPLPEPEGIVGFVPKQRGV